MAANLNYYNTEFGDDIILKILVEGETDAEWATYTIGRLETIRYEETEELREVRAVGTKFRVDARTTNFRGVFRCRLRASAINARLMQHALGARYKEGTNTLMSLLADDIHEGLTPPNQLGTGTAADPIRYTAPYQFTISIRNVRTGFEDQLFDCIFTRRSKDVSQGDFTVLELEGEYGYSMLSSAGKSRP